MFTALKKLVGTNEAAGAKPPSGMQAMEQSLQKRFARGVQYNMKIVIKGDRNVGKSCLLLRLQGLRFKEEYLPSEEIQVASIQWSYKATDDVVKVEVWDVVDKGKKRKPIEGLKLDNVGASSPEAPLPEGPALDAEFIDVYKGTNGVIMMLDITKQWTFDYVQRELPKVPANIPVLVLANHLDMRHHRNTTEDQVRFYIESVERPPGSAQIRYAESSLRNSFGLKFLYKWFNLPFLQLQRESLLLQLERNAHETDATNEELDILQESEEQNYDLFVDTLNSHRRQVADQLSSASKFSEGGPTMANGLPSSSTTANLASEATEQSQPPKSGIPPRSVSVPSQLGQSAKRQRQQQAQPSPTSTALPQGPPPPAFPPSLPGTASSSGEAGGRPGAMSPVGPSGTPTKQGLMSKLFRRDDKRDSMVVQADVHAPPSAELHPTPGAIGNVDDFVPDDDVTFSSFLDDRDASSATTLSVAAEESASDDDDGVGNPLVTGFQDDVDPEDVRPSREAENFADPPRESSEDEEESPAAVYTKDVQGTSEESFVLRGEISREDPDGTSSPAAPENTASESSSYWSMPTEDLSFLEKRYSALPQLVPKQTTPEENAPGGDGVSAVKPKKHKHKSKKEEKDRSHKHRKDRAKDKDEAERKPKKKSTRKQQQVPEDSSSEAERLEAFLGAADSPGVERAAEAYESI